MAGQQGLFPAMAFALVLVFAGGGVVASGYADMFSKSGLTPEDVEAAQAAAASLYTKSGVKKGETAEWSNASSGASGRVEVTHVDSSKSCVVVQHATLAKGQQSSRVSYRRCRDAQGAWVLTP